MRVLTRFFILAMTATCAAAVVHAEGPDFSITIATDRVSVKNAFPVKITVTVTNISSHAIWLPATMSPAIVGTEVKVLDESGKAAPETDLYRRIKGERPAPVVNHPAENRKPAWTETELPLHSVGSVEVNQGESVKYQIVVGDLFDMAKPGKYTIQLSEMDNESVEFVNGHWTGSRANSNTIVVTVTP
jgi:hypothetical protein